MENIRKVQVELLMMKTTIYKMKNILDQINSRLDTEKEKKSVNLNTQQQKLFKIKYRGRKLF